jgi:predicted nucleic acid-binding protein
MKTINNRIIVDTSIWIEYFNKPQSSHGKEVAQIIEEDRVAICGIIIAELLQGASSNQEFNELRDTLLFLPFLDDDASTWERVGRLSFELRKKGRTIPISDCLIAILAEDHACAIYSLDSHFASIEGTLLYHK